MGWVALKMLAGNPAGLAAMIAGVSLSTMLIAQQPSIAIGMVLRGTAQIRDVVDADLWVLNPEVEYVEELKPLPRGLVSRIRGVPGVDWAVPFFLGQGWLRLSDGIHHQVIVVGVDDASLVGAPAEMAIGKVSDLRRPNAALIDLRGYRDLWPAQPWKPGQRSR